MAEYIITPGKKEIPSGHLLSEELHRRAFAVEMEVHGTTNQWENIYFFDPVIPETRCFVERNLHSLVYKVSLAAASTDQSEELQATLVEIILHEVGGKVFEPVSKKSYDLDEFKELFEKNGPGSGFEPLPRSSSAKPTRSSPSFKDILWIVFSWALVLSGVYFYRLAPQPRKTFMLVACALALIGAGGITFTKTKSTK